jgi:hypothetical protein
LGENRKSSVDVQNDAFDDPKPKLGLLSLLIVLLPCDRYLRSLFTAGALAVIRYAKIHGTGHRPWLTGC